MTDRTTPRSDPPSAPRPDPIRLEPTACSNHARHDSTCHSCRETKRQWEAVTRPLTVPSAPALTCSGAEAKWCSVHGDCNCEPVSDDDGDVSLDDTDCPLHGFASPHPVKSVTPSAPWMDAVRERDAAWSPRCQLALIGRWTCGLTEKWHADGKCGHPFTYDPDADTSPEADRRRLLGLIDSGVPAARPTGPAFVDALATALVEGGWGQPSLDAGHPWSLGECVGSLAARPALAPWADPELTPQATDRPGGGERL